MNSKPPPSPSRSAASRSGPPRTAASLTAASRTAPALTASSIAAVLAVLGTTGCDKPSAKQPEAPPVTSTEVPPSAPTATATVAPLVSSVEVADAAPPKTAVDDKASASCGEDNCG